MKLINFIKAWWKRNIADTCPPDLDDCFDYNPNKEGRLWKRKK